MYMAIFAILGTLLRISLAQLFGEECANPGTVGWLAASSPLCVTADGEAKREGGIIFADLPSNILGSFLMGMMQSTTVLGLPVAAPIAWARLTSWFQGWDILHLAIRTGFCGSLTTFSSWNSEMVIMISGTGSGYSTQIISGLLGYVIGMEVTLGSFVFGKKVAEWIFRWKHPDVWDETVAIVEKKEQGVYVSPNLPEFERRFLPDLDMPELCSGIALERVELLDRWKISTTNVRRLGHPDLVVLNEIETRILVERLQISQQSEDFANRAGWDLTSLRQWTQGSPPPLEKPIPNNSALFTPFVAISIFVFIYIGLICGVVFINGVSTYAVTYRSMVYALLFAPPGALLRWSLSGMNGTMPDNWSWLPAGTLAANLLGSVVSVTAIALEYAYPVKGFFKVGTLRAVKVGFAGCLTTVSTFVSEVHGLFRKKYKQDRAYTYIVVSLLPSCLLGVLVFEAITWGKEY